MKNKNYQKENERKRITGCILLAAGFALLAASRISHTFAQWYSTHIYPLWVESIGRIAGILPFSLSELLLYVLLLWIILTTAIRINRLVRRKEEREKLKSWLWSLFLAAAALFFLYQLNCGVNYYRESFSESSGIHLYEYSAAELEETCQWLTDEVNALCGGVERDNRGVMTHASDTGERAVRAMQELGSIYTGLEGYYPEPKGLLASWILAVQNLSGIYSPFTIEANYNSTMADYNIPFTMCHELSHLRGFMQEQEANFIAFLACISSDDQEFRYSGNLMGWIYCMNVLRRVDYDAWEAIRVQLSQEAESDLQANREYWSKYDGAIAEVSNKINDTYLKANGQADGVKSYNRMVDLIVNWGRGKIEIAPSPTQSGTGQF